MSVEAVQWAMYDAPMLRTAAGRPDTTARQVLGVLGEHADQYGRNAYPGPPRISFATGLDERTVRRALDRLEEGKLITADGLSRYGTVRWNLAMDRKRPDSDWEDIQAARERARKADSAARRNRRNAPMSGTQTPGQEAMSGTQSAGQKADVRDADSRTDRSQADVSGTQTPGHAPMSGTQTPGCPGRRLPDVRDAVPPEPPSRTTPINHPWGHAAPTPLRPQGPSDLGNEQEISLYEGDQQERDVVGNQTTARAREEIGLALIPGNGDTRDRPSSPQRPIWPAPVLDAPPEPATPPAASVGFGFCLRCHAEGQITIAADPVHGAACAHHLANPTTEPTEPTEAAA